MQIGTADRAQGARLVLGTAQLGMNYGVANVHGKPAAETSAAIVRKSWERGIRFFDTAQAYGDSEERLGKCFETMRPFPAGDEPRVISKIHPSLSVADLSRIEGEVEDSIRKIGIQAFWSVLLHREAMLDAGGRAVERLALLLKESGRTKYFGVSVYSPERALQALRMEAIDGVQVPFNVFDQRCLEDGVFDLAREKGKKVFIRSVYLQGLLLLGDSLPPWAERFRGTLGRYHALCALSGLSAKQFAIGFVVSKAPDAFVVVGAETPDQVEENVSLFHEAKGGCLPDAKSLASRDAALINPSCWGR